MKDKLKLSRRDFIKLTGVASGVALAFTSGLKFTAFAKAKDNENGEGTWFYGACALCLSCPTQYLVKDGVIVDAKWANIPNYEEKSCSGTMSAVLGRTYAPDRIIYPLKRAGERGEGKFKRCRWDEVINVTAEKIKEYKANSKYGDARAFECWWGCPIQADDQEQIAYWCKKVGASISYMHGQVCFGGHLVQVVAMGTPTWNGDIVDPENVKRLYSGTQNIPGTIKAGGGFLKFLTAKKNGCKFTVIDPFLHDSAGMHDQWIPIKPGTDAALTLGIIKYVLDNRLHNKEYLQKYTNAGQLIRTDNGMVMKDDKGNLMVWKQSTNTPAPFPQDGDGDMDLGLGKTFDVQGVKCKTALQLLHESASAFTPERVVKICELPFPSRKVAEIAKDLVKNAPAVLWIDSGFSEKFSTDIQKYMCNDSLNMLLGAFGAKGGWASFKMPNLSIPQVGQNAGWPEDDLPGNIPLPKEPIYMEKNVDMDKIAWNPQKNIASAYNGNPWDAIPVMAGKFSPAIRALPWYHIDAIEKGEIKALWSTAENTVYTGTNAKRIYELCRDKLDLIIVDEQSPKDFTDIADYILPAASMHERRVIYSGSQVKNGKAYAYVYARNPVIAPPGEAKSIPWFLMKVAEKLGTKVDMEDTCSLTDHTWSDRRLKHAGILGKTSVDKLRTEGPYVIEAPVEYLGPSKVRTRTGRYEIYVNQFADQYFNSPWWKGYDTIHPVPHFIPVTQPTGENQFYLIQGKESWHQKNATQNDRYLMEDKICGYYEPTALFINSRRAAKLGLKTGDEVEVERVGPTKQQNREIVNDNIGATQRARVKVTNIIHPSAVFCYMGGGHRSPSMIKKAQEGISGNWLTSDTIGAWGGSMAKGEIIVKIRKV